MARKVCGHHRYCRSRERVAVQHADTRGIPCRNPSRCSVRLQS